MNESTESAKQTTVFYDGGCPLCRREIEHYRRLDEENRCRWADISIDVSELEARGISLATAMARLHVVDACGDMHTGAYAFAAMWDQLPYYRSLARGLRSLHVLPLLEAAYGYFALWRFQRRCAQGFCPAREAQ